MIEQQYIELIQKIDKIIQLLETIIKFNQVISTFLYILVGTFFTLLLIKFCYKVIARFL